MNRLKKTAWSNNDNILDGITFGELVDTVHANFGSQASLEDVENTFEEILDFRLQDAHWLLEQKQEEILQKCVNNE